MKPFDAVRSTAPVWFCQVGNWSFAGWKDGGGGGVGAERSDNRRPVPADRRAGRRRHGTRLSGPLPQWSPGRFEGHPGRSGARAGIPSAFRPGGGRIPGGQWVLHGGSRRRGYRRRPTVAGHHLHSRSVARLRGPSGRASTAGSGAGDRRRAGRGALRDPRRRPDPSGSQARQHPAGIRRSPADRLRDLGALRFAHPHPRGHDHGDTRVHLSRADRGAGGRAAHRRLRAGRGSRIRGHRKGAVRR